MGESRRNAEHFVITDEEFNSFLKRHASVPQLVPESNAMMRNSYLILDEYVSKNNIRSYWSVVAVTKTGTDWDWTGAGLSRKLILQHKTNTSTVSLLSARYWPMYTWTIQLCWVSLWTWYYFRPYCTMQLSLWLYTHLKSTLAGVIVAILNLLTLAEVIVVGLLFPKS